MGLMRYPDPYGLVNRFDLVACGTPIRISYDIFVAGNARIMAHLLHLHIFVEFSGYDVAIGAQQSHVCMKQMRNPHHISFNDPIGLVTLRACLQIRNNRLVAFDASRMGHARGRCTLLSVNLATVA